MEVSKTVGPKKATNKDVLNASMYIYIYMRHVNVYNCALGRTHTHTYKGHMYSYITLQYVTLQPYIASQYSTVLYGTLQYSRVHWSTLVDTNMSTCVHIYRERDSQIDIHMHIYIYT